MFKTDIKFHSSKSGVFRSEKQLVRGFVYENYSIEPHDHDFYEMNIIFGGTGIHNIENSGFEVKSGDVFVIPPETVHSYSDTNNLDVYHLLIHSDFIDANKPEASKVKGFLELIEIEPFLRKNFSDAMFLHLSLGNMNILKNELKFIEDGSEFDGDEFGAMKNHAVLKILYWLSHLLNEQINSNSGINKEKHSREIIICLDYIHHNYCEKITVESLSKLVYMSRSTFLRHFYEICGCTPVDYLNSYRSIKACELMKENKMSKTEIAHRCGFYDLSHMEKTIKKKFLNKQLNIGK